MNWRTLILPSLLASVLASCGPLPAPVTPPVTVLPEGVVMVCGPHMDISRWNGQLWLHRHNWWNATTQQLDPSANLSAICEQGARDR